MGRRYILALIAIALVCVSIQSVKAEGQAWAYIEIYYKGMSFTYEDKLIEPTDHLVAQQIFDRKINAPLSEKLAFVASKLRGGADYKTAMLTCFPLLSETVEKVKATLESPPKDSTIKFDPNSKPIFTITREKSGLKVLEDRLYMDIYFALTLSDRVRVPVPIQKLEAEVKAADNIALTGLRAQYTTNYQYSTDERKHNIALALSKINGKVICAGAELSFNETVGHRTAKNGFKEAKIIMNGKYVPGVGGGVCQASTALYNAALLGGLEVVQVHRHTLQSSYELPSFDAMVNSGSSDLVIRNVGDSPIFIRTLHGDTSASVQIYGAPLPYEIRRKSEVTFTGTDPGYEKQVDYEHSRFDEDAESGTEKIISYPHPEVHSEGYLLYYDKKSGVLVKKEHIRTDVYASVMGVIAVAP